MGGVGSGRYTRVGAKQTVDERLSLDVNWLHHRGYLSSTISSRFSWKRGEKCYGNISIRADGNALILEYRYCTNGGVWKQAEERVNLDWTKCNYGGYRPWFLCPSCNKRVTFLYSRSALFLCRHCCDLNYQSQHESRLYKFLYKAQKIRMQLGGSPSVFSSFPAKPKHMHYKKYWRLHERYREYEMEHFRGIQNLLLSRRF